MCVANDMVDIAAVCRVCIVCYGWCFMMIHFENINKNCSTFFLEIYYKLVKFYLEVAVWVEVESGWEGKSIELWFNGRPVSNWATASCRRS